MKLKFLLPVFFVFLSSCSHIVEIPPSWEARETIIRLTEMRNGDAVSKFTYNEDGRLAYSDHQQAAYPSERRLYQYDSAGRIASMSSGGGEHQYNLAYNTAGQAMTEYYLHEIGGEASIEFEYDQFGRLSKQTSYYRNRKDGELTYAYGENAVTVEFVVFYFDEPEPAERRLYTFDGKRPVRGTSDAFAFELNYRPVQGNTVVFPSYMGNIACIQTEQGDTLAEYSYVYNTHNLPTSSTLDHRGGAPDVAMSFTYATE